VRLNHLKIPYHAIGMKFLLILLILMPLCLGNALAFSGQVIGISDGDTLTVLVDKKTIKIRIAEIDAPESKQAFGTRSKQALSDLCYRVVADVEEVSRDRYGRTVARVSCGGKDVATSQVRGGMAWVYDRYSYPSSPLYPLQEEARVARRGLWADAAPVAPWEWRRNGRSTAQ
jgi:micrococcal nuclease